VLTGALGQLKAVQDLLLPHAKEAGWRASRWPPCSKWRFSCCGDYPAAMTGWAGP